MANLIIVCGPHAVGKTTVKDIRRNNRCREIPWSYEEAGHAVRGHP